MHESGQPSYARSYARERELATRLALGASRTRLLQQLLVESLLIAILGTAAIVITVPVVTRFLASFVLGNNRTAMLETAPDMRVFGFVTIAAVIATVAIGLLPALRATSKSLNEQIKSGPQATTPHGRRRLLPQLLMGIQVALGLVLVVGAGLLATSVARLYRNGLGFDPHGVITLGVAMGKQPLDGMALLQWYQSLGDRLMRLPGVRNVSFAGVTPMSGSSWSMDLRNSANTSKHEALANEIAAAFFQTMHIRLISGRDFRWNDLLSSGRKIILSRTAAERLFPKEFPIGQHVIDVKGRDSYEVIAVVDDIRYASMREAAQPEAYLPITQREEHKPSYTAVVRLFGGAGSFASGARSLLEEMSPGIPAPVILPLETDLDMSISSERMMAVLAVFFAGCSLLVTAIGLYGTLAYATARRTSEIGIRMALGAKPQQIVALIFRENAWIAGCGSLLGLVLALLASRALVSFLFDTSVRDPWVLLGSVAALTLIASAASIIPAVRAAKLEPTRALRVE